MTNGEAKYCECCGQRINERWESLSRGLVKNLEQFARAIQRLNRNDIHLQKDLQLTKNQYNNFQKLRYFALIAKVNVAGKRKSGRWLLTRRGAQFLKGEISIPKQVRVRNNKVEGYSDEKVTIEDVLGYSAYWLKAEDYAPQSSVLF